MADLEGELRVSFERRLRRFPEDPDLRKRTAAAVARSVRQPAWLPVAAAVAAVLVVAVVAFALIQSRRHAVTPITSPTPTAGPSSVPSPSPTASLSVAPNPSLPASVPPAARAGFQLAYDGARKAVVLFGGTADGGTTAFSDTWIWDGAWHEQHPAQSPPARRGGMMVYDAVHRVVVLFGGWTPGPQGIGQALADTWTWDGVTWTERHPAASPGARADGAIDYDDALQKVVLSGVDPASNRTETWAWDGRTWALLDQTSWSEFSVPMAYHVPTRQLVAWTIPGGTETFDGERWHAQSAGGPTGTLTTNMDLSRLDAAGMVVMFGGAGSSNTLLDTTWVYDGTTWRGTGGSPSPPARHSGGANGMVYDADLKVVVLFGGEGANGPLADTWTFNGAAWSKVGGNCPSSAPVPVRLPLPHGRPSPATTPAQDATAYHSPDGWSLMVPAGYEVQSPQIPSGLPHTEIVPSAQAGKTDRLPLLVVWTGGSADSAPNQVQLAPPALRTDIDWQNEYSFGPAVGGVTATVSRAPIDLCVLPGAAAGPAAGWPFLLTFTARTAAHTYFFMFLSDTPEAALVQQVMQSISLR